MSYVTTEDFQREGRQVHSEMTALNEAVDRTTAQRAKLGADKVPFPDGPWWQRWEGFWGSWTQYYDQQIRPTPILPFHDDGDIQEWARQLDTWKAEFSRGQAQNAQAARELGGPTGPTLPKGSGGFNAGSLMTYGLVVGAVVSLGYFVSSTANLKRAFS